MRRNRGMMRRGRWFILPVLIVAGCLLGVRQPLYPAVLSRVNIRITAKVTTHPDTYKADASLSMGSPVVSDLDCDSVLEIISAGYDADNGTASVYVWERNGSVRDGWPVTFDGEPLAYATEDIDGDGILEIEVIGADADGAGQIYAWDGAGNPVDGYPEALDFIPGDIKDGDAAFADLDEDGGKELVYICASGIYIIDDTEDVLAHQEYSFASVSNPVVYGNNIFFAADTGSGAELYGFTYSEGALALSDGFPVNEGVLNNTGGEYLSLADIDGDDTPEIVTGAADGYIAAYSADGTAIFSVQADADGGSVYQPVIADVDNDGNQDIIAGSARGELYSYDTAGNPVEFSDWPEQYSFGMAPGMVLADIDQDGVGDAVNPAGDLELLFSGNGRVYTVDMPGDFEPETIQWGMHGFNNRNTGNWEADYRTDGWSIFDDDPEEAEIGIVYDWNRGGRVVELSGAGLNNGYAFMNEDGTYLDTKNTQLQWSMRYSMDFVVYVSVDTAEGRRYLVYTAGDGDNLAGYDESGKYVHHGLGDVQNGRWHTFSRSLVSDLHDAEPENDVVDINAFYIQGSGRIDDVMFLPGAPAVDLVNYAGTAEVTVSGGDSTKGNINDGDADTVWTSDAGAVPWVEYTWSDPLEEINKVTLENVTGSDGGVIFIVHSDGSVTEAEFSIDGGSVDVVFDNPEEDVTSIVVVFNSDGGSVSVGEIGVYYDPNYGEDELVDKDYSSDNYIQMKDGYFWNPSAGDGAGGYWIPHGIAYQTWNKALGQWQSPAELRNDLDKMVSAGANAVRVDFVWKHIEEEDNVFSWDNYDMLLEEAQARGLKVFPVIGYQWPPDWFPEEWYTKHPQSEAHPDGPWLSDILSYENEDVRQEFADFLQAVVSRYSAGGAREDLGDTVAGWILGNEFGYLGLWSVEYDGYDDACQGAFRAWLEDKYGGDIEALNGAWAKDNTDTPGYLPNYPYTDFSEVDMPIPFGYTGDTKGEYLARDKASWYDLTEWREESIAGFIAMGAAAVKASDPGHLITYAAVGMQWGEEDWRYHTEDARKIVQACSSAGAPLDFWSINNYPWAKEDDELMTGMWGIERACHDTGMPVMVTETGFTSTETIYSGVDEDRQALLDRNAVWEALESGAIGVCVFHWNDRSQLGLTERELGFGIVDTEDNPKPAYYAVEDAFEKMDEIGINELLPQFTGPAPDIAFLWDDAEDSIVNRYEAEMHQLFGAFARIGFHPGFIDEDEMLSGGYLDYKAVILPRNQKMLSDVLNTLPYAALAGVKIYADADLPGIMDEYGNSRSADTDWLGIMDDLFGVDTSASSLGVDPDLEDTDYSYGYYETSSFSIDYKSRHIYSSIFGIDKDVDMWKYRDTDLQAGTGDVLAWFDSEGGAPAVIMNDYTKDGIYDTALSLFSAGDSENWSWEDRYSLAGFILTDADYGLDIAPELDITGSPLVLVNYRVTDSEDMVLLSFKNYSGSSSETVSVTGSILAGKAVEDLINGTVIDESNSGTITEEIEPDGHSLLLAYEPEQSESGEDTSSEGDTGDSSGGSSSDSDVSSDTSSDTSSSDTSSSDTSSSDTSSSDTSSSDTSSSDTSSSATSSSDTSSSDTSSSATSSSDTSYSSADTTVTTTTTDSTGSTDSTDSSFALSGSASVVILGEGEEPQDTAGNSAGGAGSKTGNNGKCSYFRTYMGRARGSAGTRQAGQKDNNAGAKELPPVAQFTEAVRNMQDNMPGIVRAVPKRVSNEYLKKTLKEGLPHKAEEHTKPSSPEIPEWALKLFNWVEGIIEKCTPA